ncbi:hypothetical protein PLICRDRAFT_171802 [Plicaturopsis crispa FD-325 SS-3]|nr:hypothetical protein PLICRDRAFT_171802 [Plicaturopsis crispa FD-325 SS-3]
MSDELAQDEADAEDYDLEALEHRTRLRDDDDDDAATLVGRREGGAMAEDHVVFEIGDEDGGSDDDEELTAKKHREERPSLDGGDHEREGLISGGGPRRAKSKDE